MKKMNYLISVVCVLIFSACTNENATLDEELQFVELRGKTN